MTLLDILLLAIIGISGLLSLRIGLIREAFALAALLIGLLAAIVLGQTYGNDLPDWIGNPVATQVLFFLVCFLAFYLLVTLVGASIARLIKAIKLRWMDHLLGFVFGAIRGAIIVVLLLAGLTLVLPKGSTLLTESRLYGYAEEPIEMLAKMLPEKAEEALRKRHEILRRLAPEKEESEDEDRKSIFGGRGIPL